MQENSLQLNLCLQKRKEVHSYLSLSVSYNIDSETIVAMMWHSMLQLQHACCIVVVYCIISKILVAPPEVLTWHHGHSMP